MHFAGTLPSPNGRECIASTRCYAPASGECNSRAYACHARLPDGAPRQHIASKATLRLRKEQHARSRHTPLEPTRGMRRCPAAAVGAAAMKEPGHWRARPTGRGRGRDIDARRLPGAREGHRRAPSVERGGIRPRAFAGARQCHRLRAIPAAEPTALQEHQ